MPHSRVACNDLPYVIATDTPFIPDDYDRLLDAIGIWESRRSLTEIIASYTDGTHPYFKYQESVLELARKGGERFYASLFDFMQRFEETYPSAVVTYYDPPPSTSFLVRSRTKRIPGGLPLELLDIACMYLATADLVRLRLVNQEWCSAASRFSHSSIRLRLHWNWHQCVWEGQGEKKAAMYGFVKEAALLYCAGSWGFLPWVRNVTSENWVTMPAPFYFRSFPGVRSVKFVGFHCSLRHFPAIVYPFCLPLCVESVTLSRCSLRGHSMETLLMLCDRLKSVELLSVYGGHVVSPGGLIFDFNRPDILAWRAQHGIDTILAAEVRSPSAPTIKRLSIDFPMYVGPVKSLDTDHRGTPTLLLHLFPPAHAPYLAAFMDPGEVYPIRLRTSGLEELELRMTPHIFYALPLIAAAVGNTVTSLTLSFSLAPQLRAMSPFSLVGFTNLSRLRVTTSTRQLGAVLAHCATWSALARTSSESAFDLTIYHRTGQLAVLETAFCFDTLSRLLVASAHNHHRPLHGSFRCTLTAAIINAELRQALSHLRLVADRLQVDGGVHARIEPVESAT